MRNGRKGSGRSGMPKLGFVSLIAMLSTVAGSSEVSGQQEERALDEAAEAAVADTALPTLRAQRTDEDIRIDGRLEENIWTVAPSYLGFVQKEPVEAAPAINDSEVWIVYDDDAVYVGAKLYDEAPATIARNMVRRDANYNGQFDYFEFMVDPNRDGRTGYRFRVSAANVQTDRYLFDDGGEDPNWDGVWASGVTITSDGWHVEFRIPLSQIRYEAGPGEQTWGINFGRRRASDGELTRFALESKLVPGRVSQFGLLEGVSVNGTPHRLELRPYALSRAASRPEDVENPFVDGSDLSGQFGVDFRYGLGSNFTLDATLNPDFGQVEVDPAVINLSAFETFFDERRPFFVEDARVFDFNLSGGQNKLFYTRRIGRAPHGNAPGGADASDIPDVATILGAAKVTGRTPGGLSVGAMAALTGRETGTAFFAAEDQYTDFIAEPRGGYGVLRLQQDWNAGQSRVGGIATALRRGLPSDGSFDDLTATAYNAGIDFEHNWSDRTWAIWGFLAGSHVRGDSTALIQVQRSSYHYFQRPDARWASFDSTRTALTGAEWRLQFEKRRGQWTGSIWAAQVTSGFEINDLGFSRNRERLDGGARVGYQVVNQGDHLRSWSVNAFTFQNWSHEALRDVLAWSSWDEAHTAGTFSVSGRGQFNNFWNFELTGTYSPDNMSRTATRGGPKMMDPGSWGGEAGFSTDNRRMVTFRPSVQFSRGRLESGNSLEARATVTVQPSSRVQIELSPRFDQSTDGAQYVSSTGTLPFAPTFGTRYLFADLERNSVSMVTRVNWTFSPTLTLQLYAQPLISSGDYVSYKQLAEPSSYAFSTLEEGTLISGVSGFTCSSGRTCEGDDHRRYVDFDGDGRTDQEFTDRDFSLRSLIANTVLRWEYRPGSTIFFVWQRRQANTSPFGTFDLGRDLDDLWGFAADNTFIVKMNLWLSL